MAYLLVCRWAFLTLFTIEFIMRIFGLGIRGYFKSLLNVLDFFLLVLGYIDFGTIDGDNNFFVFRPIRLLRLVRPCASASAWRFWQFGVNPVWSGWPNGRRGNHVDLHTATATVILSSHFFIVLLCMLGLDRNGINPFQHCRAQVIIH